jgi:6-phosphogluconolactonase (cycloisomerase 2 family)
VTAFQRNLATGALAPVTVAGGCTSETALIGCVDGVALDRPYSIAIPSDGKHLYVASENSFAVVAFQRDRVTGALAPLQGLAACTSADGTGGLCTNGRALREARWVSVSPDGKHVYVAAESSDAVAVFARNRITGQLQQVTGAAGCVSRTGLDGEAGPCNTGRGLDGPVALAISPDNKHVYVASLASEAVAVFTRNRLTGALTQLTGAAGCVNESGADGCTVGAGLAGARSVAVSQDGKHVYVAAQSGNAVAVFSRNRLTGALTQVAAPDGCVTEDGHADCNSGIGLMGARAIAVSRDGRSVYVGSFTSDAVAAFKRQR